MDTATVRLALERARQAARQGDMECVVQTLDHALAQIDADRLLTTMEAAQLLGIRSPNTILAWCRTGYLHGVKRGGRTLVPLSEVERIREGDAVRATHVSDQLHDQSVDLGSDEGLSQEEIDLLHATRPGMLPWERAREAAG
jgi:hypothetical protein